MGPSIYRIHRFKYLEQLLRGELVLPATDKWLDPYENLPSWCVYRTLDAGGKIQQHSLSESRLPTFGLCWTAAPESEAIWHRYSACDPPEDLAGSLFTADEGVRLRTTQSKLLSSLVAGMGSGTDENCWLCEVKYVQEESLQQIVGDRLRAERHNAFADVRGHVEALSLKRGAFRHEEEIRLLYVDADRRYEGQPYISVPVDANELIEEIMLDPRLRPDGPNYQRRKDWLRACGFKNEVTPSMLNMGVMIEVDCFTPEELERPANAGSSGQ